MFPFSALLSHAELTKRKPSSAQAVEARRAPRQMRYGNLTLFPRVEQAEMMNQREPSLEDPRVIASISNVSSSGVGLIVSEELPSGLEFDVSWPQGEYPVPLRFSVVHSQPVAAGMYRTGAVLIVGVMPQEPMPTDFVSNEQADDDADLEIIQEPDQMVYAGGIMKFVPNIPEPTSERQMDNPPGTFKASGAFGFDKTEKLDGVTTCGWERSISLRRDGARLWLYIHSPGKKNGWGLFVNPDEFEAAFNKVQKSAESPFISTMAA